MWLSEIHRWLLHKYMCVSNTCHDGEDGLNLLQSSHMWWMSSLHMRHDMESCDQRGEDQDKTWLDEPVVSVKDKLSDDLAPMDWSNSEEQVKSRSMNQYGHVMIWSGSYHYWSCWCMCCIDIGEDGMECARQRYIYRAFNFTDHRCVEKFMTGFRIDGRTIKRDKLVCISVI
jgi:hypothetical protein